MARWQKAAWIVLLVACIAIFGCLLAYSSKYQPTAAAPQSTSQYANKEIDRRTPEERVADYTLWLERFTGLLAIVAAFQIGFFLRADRNAIRTIETMEDTARRQLRAYVFITGKPDHLPEFSDEFGISVWLIAKNSGQTPAYKVRAWNAIDFRADPHVGPFDEPSREDIEGKAPQTSLGPSRDLPLRAFYTREKIMDEHIAAINEGRLTICVWGELTYEDAFGQKRYTRYRFFLPVEKGGRIPGMQISREGNEAN